MWKTQLPKDIIGKFEYSNIYNKRLILSILNTTVTKREANNYLTKYKNDGTLKTNHCLLLIRSLSEHNSSISLLSRTINKLNLLGLNPICIVLPSSKVNINCEILDNLITSANLQPLHLNEAIKYKLNGSIQSIFESNTILKSISAQNSKIIPIIKPFAFNEVTSSRYMIKNSLTLFKDLFKSDFKNLNFDKFFILNRLGGIPSNERSLNSHVFINLSQEFDSIENNLIDQNRLIKDNKYLSGHHNYNIDDINSRDGKGQLPFETLQKHKEHLENLQLMDIVLSNLPHTSTGLITTTEAASTPYDKFNPLIYNLITDRSLISSSLPRFKKNNNGVANNNLLGLPNSSSIPSTKNSIHVTTVLKKGVDIKTFDYSKLDGSNSTYDCDDANFNKVNLTKLKNILERSFKREIDMNHYLNRINNNIASIIVIGDYDGIAILTYEGVRGNKFVYLDKFAVLPNLKGSLGISDIIFNLMYKNFPDELVWRSRKTNVVNKWYFERSTGVLDLSIKIDKFNQKDSNFKLFYHLSDEQQRNNNYLPNIDRLKEYLHYVRDIEPSWSK